MPNLFRNVPEPKRETKCVKCGLLTSVCPCDSHLDLRSETYKAFLSVESRGGPDDVMTLVEKLPASEPYLKSLLKKMTAECQIRGAYRIDRKQGVIEMNGDKRVKLRGFFEKEKIAFVG